MITEPKSRLKQGTELAQSIAEHPLFSGIGADRLAEMVSDAREVVFKAREVVFRENSPANCFFLIKEGEVALTSGPTLVATIGPPDVLGWSWLVAPYVWQFSAEAVHPTKAIALNGARLLGMCEADPAFGYEIMKRVTRIILARLQATRKRLSEVTPRR